jgi:hypothetical protein
MLDLRNDRRKVWVRRIDMGEVPKLWEIGQPSDVNRAVWEDTKREYEDMLRRRSRWMGGVTQAEVESLLVDGWAAGAERARKLAEAFRSKLPEPASIKRRREWSDQGDELDRDRVLSGNLDLAWRRTQRRQAAAPQTVSVAMPWVHSAAVNADQLFWGGTAMLAVADLLESAGYSVELTALNAVHTNDGWLTATHVMVKGAGEPLRPDAVAGVFCHAGTYRYYGICSVGGAPGRHNSGWGRVGSCRDEAQKLADAGLVEMPQLIWSGVYSESAAVRVVEEAVKAVQDGSLLPGAAA